MNSISHQQRMMEIQHMSNACLVTLLPRVQESLQGTNKDGCVQIASLLKQKQDKLFKDEHRRFVLKSSMFILVFPERRKMT